MNEPDIRLLASEELPDEVFPGGRNADFRVYFRPEVHEALWKHAGEDTTVEICGVLVGSWHRDEAGPFVKVVGSIRGEGAEKRFAEVTFTHQTWAKINAEMDTRFADLKIVGWYHTHPDFGIFLSDRDRFIQEHFFSGPGQVAHVIDPVRRIEGVFVWRDGKPALADHFWIGDRIVTGNVAAAGGGPGSPAAAGPGEPRKPPDALLPTTGRLIIYLGIFLVGYSLATAYSSWERRRYTEAEVASNGVAGLLRLGLSEALDQLRDDLAAAGSSIDAARSKPAQVDEPLERARHRLAAASQRAGALKARYGNTPEVDAYLRRFLLEQYAQAPEARPDREPASPKGRGDEAAGPSPPAPADPRKS